MARLPRTSACSRADAETRRQAKEKKGGRPGPAVVVVVMIVVVFTWMTRFKSWIEQGSW
jgi:hypothetical protein